MSTPTYVSLATITLGSTDSEVTFSSIPATYRDLIVVIDGSNSGADQDVIYTLNGDNGTNYSSVLMYGSGSAASFADTRAYALSGRLSTGRSNTIIQFLDYSATDKHKTALNRGNTTTFVQAGVSRWANTAAVNTIALKLLSSNTYSSGTTFSLYGISA
jgi:hypothetical protein